MKISYRGIIASCFTILTISIFTFCHKYQGRESPDYRVLVIGNSLSDDAFSYVPYILKSVCPDKSVKIGVLYYSGCTTAKHYEFLLSEDQVYRFHIYTSDTGVWSTKKNVSSKDAILSDSWDIIVTNTFSRTPNYYQSVHQSLGKLIEGCYELLSSRPPFFWVQTPAHANSYEKMIGDYSSNEYFLEEVKVCQSIDDYESISGIIPCGTAIQIARNSHLNQYGDGGELTYDTLHLQEGLPRLIDGYVVSQFLLDYFQLGKDIVDSSFIPNSEFFSYGNSLGKKGAVCGITEDNIELAKKIVHKALDDPFIIDVNELMLQ